MTILSYYSVNETSKCFMYHNIFIKSVYKSSKYFTEYIRTYNIIIRMLEWQIMLICRVFVRVRDVIRSWSSQFHVTANEVVKKARPVKMTTTTAIYIDYEERGDSIWNRFRRWWLMAVNRRHTLAIETMF